MESEDKCCEAIPGCFSVVVQSESPSQRGQGEGTVRRDTRIHCMSGDLWICDKIRYVQSKLKTPDVVESKCPQ